MIELQTDKVILIAAGISHSYQSSTWTHDRCWMRLYSEKYIYNDLLLADCTWVLWAIQSILSQPNWRRTTFGKCNRRIACFPTFKSMFCIKFFQTNLVFPFLFRFFFGTRLEFPSSVVTLQLWSMNALHLPSHSSFDFSSHIRSDRKSTGYYYYYLHIFKLICVFN